MPAFFFDCYLLLKGCVLTFSILCAHRVHLLHNQHLDCYAVVITTYLVSPFPNPFQSYPSIDCCIEKKKKEVTFQLTKYRFFYYFFLRLELIRYCGERLQHLVLVCYVHCLPCIVTHCVEGTHECPLWGDLELVFLMVKGVAQLLLKAVFSIKFYDSFSGQGFCFSFRYLCKVIVNA